MVFTVTSQSSITFSFTNLTHSNEPYNLGQSENLILFRSTVVGSEVEERWRPKMEFIKFRILKMNVVLNDSLWYLPGKNLTTVCCQRNAKETDMIHLSLNTQQNVDCIRKQWIFRLRICVIQPHFIWQNKIFTSAYHSQRYLCRMKLNFNLFQIFLFFFRQLSDVKHHHHAYRQRNLSCSHATLECVYNYANSIQSWDAIKSNWDQLNGRPMGIRGNSIEYSPHRLSKLSHFSR